jgi:hypothetical protein
MQTEKLTQIKRQIMLLDDESKRRLADFLANEIRKRPIRPQQGLARNGDRHEEIEWLKQNRQQYAGKYVALSDSKLVGIGPTLAAARTKAEQQGFTEAFVTYVFGEDEEAIGGW